MGQAAVTPQSTDSLAKFNHLMNVAKKIAEINPNGLHDLIRAILRPLQAEQLLGVAERGQDAVPLIEAGHFFGSAVRDHLFSEDGVYSSDADTQFQRLWPIHAGDSDHPFQ